MFMRSDKTFSLSLENSRPRMNKSVDERRSVSRAGTHENRFFPEKKNLNPDAPDLNLAEFIERDAVWPSGVATPREVDPSFVVSNRTGHNPILEVTAKE